MLNHEMALFIINNPQHRDARTIRYVFGAELKEALDIFKALNIDPSTKPQECRG